MSQTSGMRQEDSLADLISDLKGLVVAYVRQRTVDPLKGLVRFVIAGVLGSVMLAVGLGTLLLAGLRFLQSGTGGAFSGQLSWLPYLIVAVVGIVVAAAAAGAAAKGRRSRR